MKNRVAYENVYWPFLLPRPYFPSSHPSVPMATMAGIPYRYKRSRPKVYGGVEMFYGGRVTTGVGFHSIQQFNSKRT